MTYTIYSARLQSNQYNERIGSVDADSADQAKDKIKSELNRNPFYTVIVDENAGARFVKYNEHLPFNPKPTQK